MNSLDCFARTLSTDRLQEAVNQELAQQIQEAKSKRFRETEFVDERTTMLAFSAYQLLDACKKYSVTETELACIINKLSK